MAHPPLSDERLAEIKAAVLACGSMAQAAKRLGVAPSTITYAMQRCADGRAFSALDVPSELPTAEELLTRRATQFTRKRTAIEARALLPVAVVVEGPIGVAFVGDPHVDDDGTDIGLLRSHVALFQRHEALLPVGIGDYSNNWVGRLARLYGQQSLSAAEAWVLVEWLVHAVDWLVLVSGNHDAWSGDGDPIQWMAKAARVQYEANGARLGLMLPAGRTIRINARHDFQGRSQWNTAHGVGKAAQLGWRDHILTAGHTHVSGIQVVRDPMSGLISHALRIGSYKTHDRYAEERGLPNQTFMVCPVVVIRPTFADDDNRLLTTFFEPETAAEFLTWVRKKKSERP